MKNELAIVIPAYKAEFLKETLESIAAQTCQDFTLYIGDDASPDNLKAIIEPFKSKIKLQYVRFSNNLGGIDLVAHWNRCIDLVGDEKWIWLFSDDDLMQTECVAEFYVQKMDALDVDLFHFDMVIIDKTGAVTKTCNPFPERINVADYFYKRINFQVNSTVIEFIFRKETYDANDGFVNYDLAWCADDATWIKFGAKGGIKTIVGPSVSWRYSGSNISSQVNDKKTVLRKMNATVDHMKWVGNYFNSNNLHDITTDYQKLKWAVSLLVITPAVSLKEKITMVSRMTKQLKYKNVRLPISLYLIYKSIRSN